MTEQEEVAKRLALEVIATAKKLAEAEEARKEVDKSVLKDALKEWLDEKLLIFGKWSLGTVAAMVLAAIIYFVLMYAGWRPPV